MALNQKVSVASGISIEFHTASAPGEIFIGQHPASIHDGGANVPASVVVSGTGKQLRSDTTYARITNPA